MRCNPTLFNKLNEKLVLKSNAIKSKSSSKLRNLILSSSIAELSKLSKDLVYSSKTESKPIVSLPSKNLISILSKGVKSNLSLFNKPSKISKSKSKSSIIKLSKNLDHSARIIFNNFNKTREELESLAKKDLKSIKLSNNTKLPTTTIGLVAQLDFSYNRDSLSVSKQEEYSSLAKIEFIARL